MHAKRDVINMLRPAGRRSGLRLLPSEMRLDDRARLGACDDRYDLERHSTAAPLKNPGLDEAQIVAAHELETA